MIKTGAGTLTVDGFNTYTGSVQVQSGQLVAQNNAALGASTGATNVAAGATLQLKGIVTTEPISLAGTISSAGISEIQGTVTLSGTPFFTSGYSSVVRISGVIQGSPTETKIGYGTVEFAGTSSNTYTGPTNLSAGGAILQLNKSVGTALGGPIKFTSGLLKLLKPNQIADSAELEFVSGGTLDLNGMTETVSQVYGTTSASIYLGDGSLTLNGSLSCQLGSSSHPCRIYGSSLATLRKKGLGTLLLYHASDLATAAQDTTLYVQGGVLELHGQWLSPIRVVTGSLMGAAETGSITAAGGDVDLLDFKASSITTTGLGGNLKFAMNGAGGGTGFNQIKVTGPVDLTGLNLQTALNFLPMTSASFTVIANLSGSPVTGTFNGLPEGASLMIGGRPFVITYKGGAGGRDVVLRFQGTGTPGPEIIGMTPLPGGSVKVDVKWSPGAKITLLSTSNPATQAWGALTTLTMDGNGKASYIHPIIGGASKQFYRLAAY